MLLLNIVVCCGPLALPLHVVVRPNYSRSWPAVCLRRFCHNYCWFIIFARVVVNNQFLVLFVHEKSVNPLRSRRELIQSLCHLCSTIGLVFLLLMDFIYY